MVEEVRLDAQALFWQAHLERLAPAASALFLSKEGERAVREQYHKDWGFRVSAACKLLDRTWQFCATWTRFCSQGNCQVAEWPLVAQRARWEQRFGKTDLSLERSMHVGKRVRLSSQCGLQLVHIEQVHRVQVEVLRAAYYAARHRSDLFGFGFMAAPEGTWELARGFSLFGRSEVSWVYGTKNGSVRMEIEGRGGQKAAWTQRMGLWGLDLQIGAGYHALLYKKRYLASLRAGWEGLTFLRQIKLQRELSLQGITICASLRL